MTIDELGRMVAERFSSMQKYMDDQFEAVDNRFKSLENEVRAINQRIDTVVIPAIDDHSSRIKQLELTVN